MKQIPNIVFNLNGTLIVSAPSLCEAGNYFLKKLERTTIDASTYKNFIGGSMLKQVAQLLNHTDVILRNKLNKHLKVFREFYDCNSLIYTILCDSVFRNQKEIPKSRS